MINYIKGIIVEKENNKIILDKDGIAFDVYFPSSSMYKIDLEKEVKVYIHVVFSQDDIVLYGFLTKEDKQMFELLLVVNRLGPKGAMNIISNLGCANIKSAIIKKDSKAFSSISGIGQKVADKIIIDLYDKMKTIDIDMSEANSINEEQKELQQEAIEALMALGYNKKIAESLINKVEMTENIKLDELIKLALKK